MEGGPKPQLNNLENNEQIKPLGIEFFVTDHNLRANEVSIEKQKELYIEMKKHGISSIRFDWDWKEVSPPAECSGWRVLPG